MNFKKILAFALGPLASAFFGIVTLPLMAWIFSPEDIGRINLLQMVLSFSLLFLVLGLDQAYVREFHETVEKPELLKACFAPGFILLLACIILTAAFGGELAHWVFGIDDPMLYALMMLCATANYFSRFLSLILRMQERGLAFSMSQIIPKALQLILLGAVVAWGIQRKFTTILWITAASSIAVLIVYAWNTKAQWLPAIRSRPHARQTYSLLKFGFPLIFSGLAYWGLSATSTFVLRAESTLSELGVYSVTASFAAAAAIFQSIFTVVWAPTVYKWVSEGVDMACIDDVARKALAVVCVIFILVGSFSWVIDYMLPAHYANVKYLVVCAIAPPLLYTLSEITCVGIGIMRRTVLTIWITLAALATNVALSVWLVPTYGATGAVTANALAYLVYFVARTEASAFSWRHFPRLRLYIISSIAVAFSATTAMYGANLFFHNSFFWATLTPVVIWQFRIEIGEIFFAVRSARISNIPKENG